MQTRSVDSEGRGYYSDGHYCWYDFDLWEQRGLSIYLPIRKLKEFSYIQNLVSEHERILEADLSYPVTMTPDGDIADGYHRIARALHDGQTHVQAIVLFRMPKPFRKVSLW